MQAYRSALCNGNSAWASQNHLLHHCIIYTVSDSQSSRIREEDRLGASRPLCFYLHVALAFENFANSGRVQPCLVGEDA